MNLAGGCRQITFLPFLFYFPSFDFLYCYVVVGHGHNPSRDGALSNSTNENEFFIGHFDNKVIVEK